MFTGIVRGLLEVSKIEVANDHMRIAVKGSSYLLENLQHGASVAIDGTCLTVVLIDEDGVWFDVIKETLKKTTLGSLKAGDFVNVERSAKFGDEIGGHLLSGHVYGTGKIHHIDKMENHCSLTCRVPAAWMKYLLNKGFIAVDGVSLTVSDVDPQGLFTLHLIPETLKLTKLGSKSVGDLVNIEIDSRTQTIVETLLSLKNPEIGDRCGRY